MILISDFFRKSFYFLQNVGNKLFLYDFLRDMVLNSTQENSTKEYPSILIYSSSHKINILSRNLNYDLIC